MGRLVRSPWLAGAVAVILAVVLGFELAGLRHRRGLPTASDSETAVARRFAVAATSFDYRQISQDTARVVALGTPAYRSHLLAALGPNFVDGIVANRRVSAGTIAEGPVVQRVQAGQVVFLVIVTQRVTSEGSQSAPQRARVAFVVTVSRSPSPQVEAVQDF